MTPRTSLPLPPLSADAPAAHPRECPEATAETPSVPAWVYAVDQAAWVAGPDRRLRWMNRRAETLLGVRAADALGLPCDTVVRGRDGLSRGPESGRGDGRDDGYATRPFCGGHCAIRAKACRGDPVGAHDVVVGPVGPRERWARFTSIPVAMPGGVGIVHLATDIDAERRAAGWTRRLAARSAAVREADPRPTRALTPRESEILDLLAEDEELPRIAHALGISRTTARNHVQRLLAALGAHSVQEAVALRVLRRV